MQSLFTISNGATGKGCHRNETQNKVWKWDVDRYQEKINDVFEFGKHPNTDKIKCKMVIDYDSTGNKEKSDKNVDDIATDYHEEALFLYPQHPRDYFVYCIDFENDLFCIDDRKGNHQLAIKISMQNLRNLNVDVILNEGDQYSWEVYGE